MDFNEQIEQEQPVTEEEQELMNRIQDLDAFLNEKQFTLVDFFIAATTIIRHNFDKAFFNAIDEKERQAISERLSDSYDETIKFINELPTETAVEDILILLSILEFAILPAVKEMTEEPTEELDA